jgi:sensor histidine kinase YesM
MFLVLDDKLLKERKDRNLQVSNLEAKAYRAQMNPHFIFNALNGMQTAMILGGEEEFNKYITSFSKLIRNTIEMSSVDRISIADEVAYITNYIDLQGHRLEQKIDLEFTIDPKIDPDEVFLPCMMLQPIVENSIVHGIIPKEDKGKITIDLVQENQMLKVSVTDNGIGRKAAAKQKEKYAKHKSFATQIMRDRINIFNNYNDRKLKFHIEDLYNDDGCAGGTRAILYVPLDLKTRH